MIPSSRDLIAGIVRTLEQDVLPELAGATWTASHIRSCVMLLTHLEERVVHEGPILYQDNIDLRALLGRLRTDLSGPLPETATQLSAVLDATPPPTGYPATEALDDINRRLKAALEQTVTDLHDARQSLGESRFQALDGAIMAYLTAAIDRDNVMFEKAATKSPL